MYGYFYLASIHAVPRWFNPMAITTAQVWWGTSSS